MIAYRLGVLVAQAFRHWLLFLAAGAICGGSIWVAGCLSDADASQKQGRRFHEYHGTVAAGGFPDAAADGGDAAADGGDAAADGGDAAADGGDAQADGGDAQLSPLDDHTSTRACAWDWVLYSSGSLNPLTAYAGGSTCDVAENALPNESGEGNTSGLVYIGNRTNWFMNNNTSGGWAVATTWAGPAVTSAGQLIRVVVKTPATFGTQTIFTLQDSVNGDTFKVAVDATPRFIGSWDDGPGALASSVVTGIHASTIYLVDLFIETSFKTTMCVNGTCVTGATASGSTGMTPNAIGIGSSTVNTAIFTGSILDVQYHNGTAGWWSTAVHTSECATLTGGVCAL